MYVAGGAVVRIYFGSPDSAPCLNQSTPLIMNSNSKILPTGAGPIDVALLVVGSDTKATSIDLNSNTQLPSCPQSFVLYAPRTALTFNCKLAVLRRDRREVADLRLGNFGGVNNAGTHFELPNTVAGHYAPRGLPRVLDRSGVAPERGVLTCGGPAPAAGRADRARTVSRCPSPSSGWRSPSSSPAGRWRVSFATRSAASRSRPSAPPSFSRAGR